MTRRTIFPALLAAFVTLGVAAAPAAAAPCTEDDGAGGPGLARDTLPTGTSSFTLTMSSYGSRDISVSLPAPASVGSVTTSTGDNPVTTVTATFPAAGTVAMTVSWTKDGLQGPCTAAATVPVRVVAPVDAHPVGRGGFNLATNGVGAAFSFPGCEASRDPEFAAPMTIVVRARVGARRRPFTPFRAPPVPPPTATSPTLTLAVPKPCTSLRGAEIARGGAFVRFSREINGLMLRVRRPFRGRGYYSVHATVEFRQAGFRAVRFRVTGYYVLADFGRSSQAAVRRI